MVSFSDLTAEEIGQLEYIIRSPAYEGFYKPLLQGMERDMTGDLINPEGTRKFNKPDDYLRGGILTIQALLNGPELIVADYYERQMADAKIKDAEQQYADRAAAGSSGPLPFTVAPEDDF